MGLKENKIFKNLSRPWLIFMIVVMVYLGVLIFKSYFKIRQLKERLNGLEQELASQQKTNAELKEKLVELEDKYYLEKLAREKLGLVKQGEVVFKIVKKDEKK